MSVPFKLLALIFVLMLIVGLPLAVLGYDIGRVVFNPPLVKQIVGDEVVASELLPIALEWYSDEVAEGRGSALTWITEPDILQLMSLLDRSDWKAIKQEVLTDEILRGWVSVTVDGVYAWIDNSERTPQITWDMQAFKDRVNSEHGRQCIVIAYDNLSPCTQPEIEDFKARLAAAPSDTEVLYNLCEFPDPWYEDQFSDYLNSLSKVVENVPPQFALTEQLKRAQDTQAWGPETLKQQLRTIRFWMNIAWLIPLALLVLILLLAVRSVESLARWWGAPLLVSGLITLLPPLIYRSLITSVLSAGPLSETPELIRSEVIRSILRLASAAFNPMLVQAVILVLVGLGLLIWLGVRKRQQ